MVRPGYSLAPMRRPLLLAEILVVGAALAGCSSATPAAAPPVVVAKPAGWTPGAAPCAPDPHASLGTFVCSHFDAGAWSEYVAGDWVRCGGARAPLLLAAAAAAVAPFDDEIEDSARGVLGDSEWVGDSALYGLVGGSMLLGVFSPRDGRSAKDEGFARAEALLLTFGITEGLKEAVGRRRPGHSGSRSSFPSGHASAAFCAATLIDRGHGPAWGRPAYALAALAALSRLDAGRHFPADVLAGAAIGTAVGGIVDALHFGDGSRGRGISPGRPWIEVGPTVDGGMAVSLSVDI